MLPTPGYFLYPLRGIAGAFCLEFAMYAKPHLVVRILQGYPASSSQAPTMLPTPGYFL